MSQPGDRRAATRETHDPQLSVAVAKSFCPCPCQSTCSHPFSVCPGRHSGLVHYVLSGPGLGSSGPGCLNSLCIFSQQTLLSLFGSVLGSGKRDRNRLLLASEQVARGGRTWQDSALGQHMLRASPSTGPPKS